MKKQTFERLIKDAITNWSGDLKNIDIENNKMVANMKDGSKFKIRIEIIQEVENDEHENYYQD
jgi:hypothetical protein